MLEKLRKMKKFEHKNPREVFERALKEGKLTLEKGSRFVGDYMYMGTWDGKDQFKHINTRLYLKEESCIT